MTPDIWRLTLEPPMHLSEQEQAILAGEAGPGAQRAMELVVALGRIYGAADLVPISTAQVSGVSYKNLGEAGLEFLEEWAGQGARVRVPTTLNPAGLDRLAWREMGFPQEFARQQDRVIEAYVTLGVLPTCTCTPYLTGYVPRFGEHLAWAESSAVAYANSVLGARTNREGGPSALAAAIVGRTARYGLHLDEGRWPTVRVDVSCALASEADVGALGTLVGRRARGGVPYFRQLHPAADLGSRGDASDLLKTLGAAMAASGAVALFHVEGLTPEAVDQSVIASKARSPTVHTLSVDDLGPGYAALDGDADEIDLVSLGCPHASIEEMEAIAGYLEGRHVRSALWVTTARATRGRADALGLVARIEAAGGRVVADTCMVVAPLAALGFRTMATNSAKMALYAPSHSKLGVRFGTMEQCLKAAVRGRWEGSGGQEAGARGCRDTGHRKRAAGSASDRWLR